MSAKVGLVAARTVRVACPGRPGRAPRPCGLVVRRSVIDRARGSRRSSHGAPGQRVPSICLTEACTVAQYRAVDGLLERLVAVIRVASPGSSVARSASGGAPPVRGGCRGGSWGRQHSSLVCIGTLAEQRRPSRSPASAARRRDVRGFDVPPSRRQRRALPLLRRVRPLRGFAYGTPHQVARHGAVGVETTSYIPQKNALVARWSVTSRGARAWDAINYVSGSALFSCGGVLSRGARRPLRSLSRGVRRPLMLSRGARRPLMLSRGARRPLMLSRGARRPLMSGARCSLG